MIPDLSEARQAIQNAREALRRGDRRSARRWAERAAALVPHMEESWLILAAVASPRASIAYLEQVLKVNPNSQRARAGMHWAVKRLREQPAKPTIAQPPPQPPILSGKALAVRRSSFPSLLLAMIIVILAWAAWSGNASPALAFIRSNVGEPQSTHAPAWSEVEVVKPTYTSTPTDTPTPTPTFTPTPTPTDTPTPTPTFTPTFTPLPTDTPWPTSTPQPYVPDNPTRQAPGDERWIDVDLSAQRVYAYEGNTIVRTFIVSTGTWQYPTVTGKYRIYVKLRYTDMAGPGYYLPDVPYTMYFYKGYALHGTYWHNNFGTPMSRGCINLRIPDAEWLYYWASVGTLVNIHH